MSEKPLPSVSNDEPPLATQIVSVLSAMRTQLRSDAESLPPIDADTHLEREIGLDSLARMEFLTRVESVTGQRLDEQAVMAAERVGDLFSAARIEPDQWQRGIARQSIAPAGDFVGDPLREATLKAALEWHVQRHPNRVHVQLLSDEGAIEPITYGELHHRGACLAAGLVTLGVSAGDRVALMLPTGREYLESFVACVLLGAVPVPIYPPARAKQIEEHFRRHERILSNAGTRVLITFEQVHQVSRLLAAAVPGLDHLTTPALLRAQAPLSLAVRSQPSDLAFIQYTSGSTGDPKGVALSHENLLASLRSMAKALQVTPNDVFVSWLPLYHDMGLIGAWMGALTCGFPLVLMSPLAFLARPVRWLEAIAQFGGTISGGPNFAYELCLRRIDPQQLNGIDLSSWRLAFNGAEPVSASTIAAFAQQFAAFGFSPRAMTPVYGLAEATLGVTFTPSGRGPKIETVSRQSLGEQSRALPASAGDDTLTLVSSGVPIPEFEVRIMSGSSAEVADRGEGEIQFRGPGASSHYFNNPQATAGLKDGEWTRTGDRGFMLDGELYITGRDKDVVIRAGRNLYPYALESALAEVQGVRRGCVAVIGANDPDTGHEALVVIAESRDSATQAHEAMRRQIEALTIEHMGLAADHVLIVPPHTVLKTSSGKIRRAAMAERFTRGVLSADAPRATWLQLGALTVRAVVPSVARWLTAIARAGYAVWWAIVLGGVVMVSWPLLAMCGDRRRAWRIAKRAGRALFALTGVNLQLTGDTANLKSGAVVIVNHQSYLDGLVLAAVIDVPLRFVAKSELTSFAAMRLVLDALGALYVNRFDRAQALADQQRVQQALTGGDAVAYFPEGTFHRMAGLLPFQLGAFETAVAAQAPVVPIVIHGTRHVLRGDDFVPRRGAVSVHVLAPIMASQNGESTWSAAIALRERVRNTVLAHCREPDLAGHGLMTRLDEGAP